jgi:membrane protease YdiL (CAAX protease family)
VSLTVFNLSFNIDQPTPTVPAEPAISSESAAPPPPPQWRTWLEILLCSGYPTQLAISGVLLMAGIAPTTADGGLNGRFVFALTLADTALLLSLIVVLLRRRGERPSAVFFGGRPAGPEVAAGVLSLPVVITVVVVLMLSIRRFLPTLRTVPDNPLEGLLETQATIWLFLLVVIVGGGVREELQRAFLLHRFRQDFRQQWLGLLITSLSFGMGHTLQGLDAAVVTGTLGAIWGALYLTRRSALAPMVSHSLFNSGELIRVFLR